MQEDNISPKDSILIVVLKDVYIKEKKFRSIKYINQGIATGGAIAGLEILTDSLKTEFRNSTSITGPHS